MHITMPGILPIVKILLILHIGQILNSGFEQQYLLKNGVVQDVAEVLDLFVLRYGIAMGRYSFATAAGVFKTVVSIVLLFSANFIIKKTGEDSLF